ncbi:hypothetical protein GQ600_23652 [Phytophthora cactorum]|nr:hypothetical protein GQ600_23652 [Phytophthora cactorum]
MFRGDFIYPTVGYSSPNVCLHAYLGVPGYERDEFTNHSWCHTVTMIIVSRTTIASASLGAASTCELVRIAFASTLTNSTDSASKNLSAPMCLGIVLRNRMVDSLACINVVLYQDANVSPRLVHSTLSIVKISVIPTIMPTVLYGWLTPIVL